MNATSLLKRDHKAVEALFKKFERAGENAGRLKRQTMDRIIHELSQHAAVEEQVFYPIARRVLKDEEDLVLEALEEHHVVKWTLSELEGMDPDNERFEPKAKVLFESVRHHVEEEETELFPKLNKAMSSEQLDALGTAITKAKRLAHTRPHPRAPDSPPANILLGPVAKAIDLAKDAIRGARRARKLSAARRGSARGRGRVARSTRR
jgi:hemerythrin-like domain-containing protein